MTDPTETTEPPDEATADEPGPAPEPTAAEHPARRGWRWRAVTAAAAGAGLVAAGVWLSQTVNGGGAELRDRAVRIAALESEQTTLRAALSEAEAGVRELTARMAAVDDTLAALTDAVGGAAAAADFGVLAADVDARLGALENAQSALGALESRVEALAAVPAAAANDGDGPGAAPSPAVTARLGELEQSLADLRAALDQAVLSAADRDPAIVAPAAPGLSGLPGRIAALEEAVRGLALEAGGGNGAAALVLAAGQLRDRLLGSGPFLAELDAVRQVARTRQAIDRELEAALNRLGELAGGGIATVDDLAREFRVLAGEIAAASDAAAEGWAAQIWQRLRGVVSVRRTGEIDGDSAQARVARAELRLAERDLPGAVRELDALDGAAAAAAQPWLDRAGARVAADDASAMIATRAVALLAQDFDAGP